MNNLYDVIEELDTLNIELSYYMKANKGFMESELKEVYLHKGEFLTLISGIEYTQQRLISRFEKISEELTEIMKASREQEKE